MIIKTSEKRPLGTSHWLGTYNGCPAIALSFYGGADLWYYENGDWTSIRYESLLELYNKLGIDK